MQHSTSTAYCVVKVTVWNKAQQNQMCAEVTLCQIAQHSVLCAEGDGMQHSTAQHSVPLGRSQYATQHSITNCVLKVTLCNTAQQNVLF